LVSQKPPSGKRIVIGCGERMLWGKPISNGERPRSSGAARLGHHTAMAHDRTGAIPTAMKKHQHMRDITARNDRPFSLQAAPTSTASSFTSSATGQTEPIASSRWRRSAQPIGRGLERSNARTFSISLRSIALKLILRLRGAL
jgi:hypothetical protein